VSTPKLEVAFAGVSERLQGTLTVLDLKAGKSVKRYAAQDFPGKLVGFGSLLISPDGKYLFSAGGVEQMFRWKIDGTEVSFDAASPRIIQGRFEGLCLSEQGDYVCAPAGGGNYPLAGMPRTAAYSTYIYAAANFDKPVLMFTQGAYPQAVGFDLKSGLLYAHNFSNQLIVLDTKGTKLKELGFIGGPDGRGNVRQFLVHPQGRKLLVLGEPIGGGRPEGTAPLWRVGLPTNGKNIDN